MILGLLLQLQFLNSTRRCRLLNWTLPRRHTLGIIFDDVVEEAGLLPHQVEKSEALLDAALGLTIMGSSSCIQ